jgi:flagellar basal-body rod protein FlgB
MIKTGLLNNNSLSTLKKAVEVYAKRHQVTAQNISNVQTRGYRTQELKFEDLINGANHRLQGQKTHEGHLSLGKRDLGSAQAELTETESNFDNGTNNVDIDQEMTELATTDLSYRLATRLLSMKYNGLRTAIKGRVG